MPPGDMGKKRTQTDASLRAERAKTDRELDQRRAKVEGDADEVVRSARERADAALRALRQREDGNVVLRGVADVLEGERACEDATIAQERELADIALRPSVWSARLRS